MSNTEPMKAEIITQPDAPKLQVILPGELPPNAVRAPAPDELFPTRKAGRPRKWETPEEMQDAINKYFASCVRQVENPDTGDTEYFWVDPPTIPGLARALRLTCKGVLDYQEREEFNDVIAPAKLIIEEYTAKALHGNPKATGLIFILKNLGWQDNRVVTYAPPNRLEAAKTTEQIAELIQQDIVD